jgi:choline dehydrogenase-like flavoprotein
VSRGRAATLAGNRFSVAARVVVLATGGIENARILLASRASRPNGIGNDRDLVGRFFMDHPHLRAGVYLPSSAAFDGAFYRRRDDQRAIGVLTVADALLRRDGLLGFSLTLSRRAVSRDAALDGDVQQAASDLEGGAALAAVSRPPDATVLECRTEPAPNPDSRVTLAGERDALGMPRARLDWQLTAADFASLRAGQEIVAREVGRAGVGRVQLPRDAPRSAWTQKVRGGQHHIGTTRTAEDPARGVVDAHCRVHGIENLYVAGSSVFPTAGTANPTLTLTALALRLADRIRARFA